MTTLIADIEGNGLLNTVDKIWIVSIGDADTGKIQSYYDGSPHGSVEVGIERLQEADRTVWHHGLGFDIPCIQLVLGKTIDWSRVVDTLILSKLENPDRKGVKPHALESWGHRVGVHKVPDLDWTKWDPGMISRCETDVLITARVYDKLKYLLAKQPDAVALEHGVAWETTQMIHRGMRLDVPYTQKLLGEFLDEIQVKRADLQQIFPPILVSAKASEPVKTLKVVNKNHALHGKLDPGQPYCPVVVQEFNPGSREQAVARFQKKYAWEPTVFTDAGNPKLNKDVLNELTFPEAEPLLEYFDLDKKIGQINSAIKKDGSGGGWLHHLRNNGRVHAGLNPLGTVTGRPSCSSPNVQQVSKKDKRMRKCWKPTEGRVMVGVDASGLELRCLSHYLARYDDGAYMKTLLEADIHTTIMEMWGFHLRDQTKRGEYGWLYGAGDPKLGLIATQDAAEAKLPCRVPGDTLKQKGAWMRSTLLTGLTGLDQLIDEVKRRAATKCIRGLDGRNLWIRSDHSALNTLLQSAGIIIVKKAIEMMPQALAEAGYNQGVTDFSYDAEWYKDPNIDAACVMWVHDEVQLESRPEIAEDVGRIVGECMTEAGKFFSFRCPVDYEVKVGNDWAETH